MPKRIPPRLSPKLEIELRDRLEEILDEIDEVADKRRRLSRKLGGHLKILGETRDLIRRQLKGVDLEQLTLEGTEKPEPARDPLVQEILRVAGGIVEARGDGEVPPLEWHEDGDRTRRAEAGAGEYFIASDEEGRWRADWCPESGRQKQLGFRITESDAREACWKHHLERLADESLKASGSGALTKGDLKGDAVARKRAG